MIHLKPSSRPFHASAMDRLHGPAGAATTSSVPASCLDRNVVRLLTQRYGDGQVYLNEGDDPRPYQQAVNLGLVSMEGYLTAAGYSLVSRLRA